MTATTTSQNSQGILTWFKPLQPTASDSAPASPGALPGSTPQPPPPTPPPGSDLPEGLRNTTVNGQEALSGLKHTEIPAASLNTGNPSITPLNGTGSGTGGTPVALGGLLEGKWATEIVDALLPAALVAGLYAMNIKLRKSELQLTAKEKEIIAPIMQKCLDTVLLNFNSPWNALFLTYGAIYGAKLVEKGGIAWIDKQMQAKQDDALKTRVATAEATEAINNDPAKFDIANQSAMDIMQGNVILPGEMPFNEAQVRENMKKWKTNRDKTIMRMKREYNIQ